MPVDISLAAATLALSRGQAGTATYVASAVFVTAALYWWLRRNGSLWGPKPTIGLPAYALSTSAIITYRFVTAQMAPASPPQTAALQTIPLKAKRPLSRNPLP